MRKKRLIILLLFIFNNVVVFSQCEYTLDSYSHNDCYGANNGSIDITITNSNSTASWTGPYGFTSSSTALSNLYAGTYYVTITNTLQACTFEM